MAKSEVLVSPELLELPSAAARTRDAADAAGREILFAIHSPRDPHTAVYNSTRERAATLDKLGHRCTILAPSDFPWLARFGDRLVPLLFPIALARYIAARHFDVAVFHSHAGWALSILRRFLRRHRDLRTAIIFHGLEPLYFHRMHRETPLSLRYRLMHRQIMHRLLRFSCRDADLVFCLNSDEQKYLVLNRWAESERIAVLSNPAPDDFFLDRTHRKRATTLLFVGQWLPMKGIRYLAGAFSALNRTHRDIRLCLAGTLAAEQDVLRSFPDDVRPHIQVHPRVDRRQLLELHRQSDVFVFPTLSEGFSLALAEAMASGLPIVTTPVGAAPDLLHHQQSVLFVPVRDSQALLAALRHLIENRRLREKLGRFAQLSAQRLRSENSSREFRLQFERLVPPPRTRQATLETQASSGKTLLCR
jgi:glycosyltransferase involved in cell wall biosynthesis